MQKISLALIWFGWSLFLLCLALPASTAKPLDPEFGLEYALHSLFIAFTFDLSKGWEYFYFAAPSIGNLLILFAPAFRSSNNEKTPLVICGTLLFFGALAASYQFSTRLLPSLGGTFIYGYYVWVISFFVVSVGFLIDYNHRLYRYDEHKY